MEGSLWNPPDQSGWLKKRDHSRGKWHDRFFVLKVKNTNKLYSVIPLENCKVETELPEPPTSKKRNPGHQHIITITLHVTHTYSCKHAFYVLVAPTQEVQAAWVSALWQAAIPRGDLVNQLTIAGRLPNLVANYAQQLQQCFPTADASVLSTSSRARISGTVGNLGALAGILRANRASNRHGQDLAQLPVLPSSAATPSTVLARTASGSIISAAAAQVKTKSEGSTSKTRAVLASSDENEESSKIVLKENHSPATKAPPASSTNTGVIVTATTTRQSLKTIGSSDVTLRERASMQAIQNAAITAAMKAGSAGVAEL